MCTEGRERAVWIIKRDKRTQKNAISYTRYQTSWEGNIGVKEFESKVRKCAR
jgi:hypothetical protein